MNNKTEPVLQDLQHDMNFFFWLGEDSEMTPVSEIEFLDRILQTREDRDAFLNCRPSNYQTSPEGSENAEVSSVSLNETCGCSCGGCNE